MLKYFQKLLFDLKIKVGCWMMDDFGARLKKI